MARVKDIMNPWGRERGPNPQRTDLWQVDLSYVIDGLNTTLKENSDSQFPTLPDVPRYFPASISMPELKLKAEAIRRDSRPYNMPSWDEPLDGFKITFILDDGGSHAGSDDADQSTIYTILDVWRSVTRAGRGAMGSEPSIRLDKNYRIDFAYPIYLYLLKGYSLPKQFLSSQRTRVSTPGGSYDVAFTGAPASVQQQVTQVTSAAGGFANYMSQQNTLQISQILHFENAWLAGFKVIDLNYGQAQVATVEAHLYADNLLQLRRSDVVPSFI